MAREAAKKHIVIGNIGSVDLSNITVQGVRAGEVGRIGLLRVTVPFTGKNALATDRFECQTDATDTRKKINKGEVARGFGGNAEVQQSLEFFDDMRRYWLFPFFPAPDLTLAKFKVAGQISL